MKTKISLLFFLILTIFSACNKNNNTGTPGTNEIWLRNTRFDPSPLTVTAGTTVTFINKDNTTHTVSEMNSVFYSGTLKPGDTYSYKFTTAGNYNFYCNYHNSMTGTVIVK